MTKKVKPATVPPALPPGPLPHAPSTPGSVAAAVLGMAGVVLPFVPPQYQWIGQIAAAALSTFATYHP